MKWIYFNLNAFLLVEKSYLCAQNQFINKLAEKLSMTRAIITVVGKDTVGIIAKVCTYLADNNINILDISQTIVQEFFNMMMIVDMSKCSSPFDKIADELAEVGTQTGVQVKCQLEDIFSKMHRI